MKLPRFDELNQVVFFGLGAWLMLIMGFASIADFFVRLSWGSHTFWSGVVSWGSITFNFLLSSLFFSVTKQLREAEAGFVVSQEEVVELSKEVVK